MSISRTKVNWSYGEKLTAAQINAIDENVTNALDKRAGQTDTLESDVTATGDLTLSGDVAVTSAGSLVVSGSTQIFGPTVLINATGAGGQINVNGGTLNLAGRADANFATSTRAVFAPGSRMDFTGTLGVASSGGIFFDAGSTLYTAAGSTFSAYGSALLAGAVNATSTVSIGGAASLGSTLEVDGDITANGDIELASTADIIFTGGRTVTRAIPLVDYAINSLDLWTRSGTYLVGSNVNASVAVALRDVPDGATIDSIALSYNIRGAVRSPTTRLNVLAYRYSRTNPSSPEYLWSPHAQQVPAYSLYSTWLETSWTCTQNNTIDNENYVYFISVAEESSTAGNYVFCVTPTYTVTTLNPS